MKTQAALNLSRYLRIFSKQNEARPTRLGVFEGTPGNMSDLWLEDGLPLLSVDAAAGRSGLDIDIQLDQGPAPDAAHMSHRIQNVRALRIVLGINGGSDALEIEGDNGQTTVLRFEDCNSVKR